MEIVSQRFSRIEEPLALQARERPGAEALLSGERRTDYSELWSRSRAFAVALHECGLRWGDRVVVFLDNVPAAAVALYGTWAAGGVAVPIHASLKRAQVSHVLEHSGARFVVTSRRGRTQLAPAGGPGADVCCIEADPDLFGASGALPSERGPGGEQLAALLYTSGSTGRPKGIAVSHDNLLAGARIVSAYLEMHPGDRLLGLLPFSFDYGLSQLLTSVQVGATLVLQRSTFPADVCRSLERHQITGLAGVPPLWIQLMGRGSPLPGLALPKLRFITNSGGVFPVELVQRYRRQLPHVALYKMYGLSEAFRSTYLSPLEVDARPDSIGRPMAETEIFVVRPDGSHCEPGETGELVHAGPTVALGYWRDPEATARVFRPDPRGGGRVVHSGDLVRRDADGYLYFVGREDQMLKTQGFRVSPDEVEEQLLASGLLAEVAVTGEPDAVAGTAVVAHLVPRDPGGFDKRELLSWCRRELPFYMLPKRLAVHAALPRTTSGKLDRKALA